MYSAIEKAKKEGIAGGTAMAIQVASLMWLRTTINYQYRYGVTTSEAFITLYNQGGIRRFYRGIGAALLQAPLSRFGDTAANAGTLGFFNNHNELKNVPIPIKTLAASITAAGFRTLLMPIDTVKTVMQVDGNI